MTKDEQLEYLVRTYLGKGWRIVATPDNSGRMLPMAGMDMPGWKFQFLKRRFFRWRKVHGTLSYYGPNPDWAWRSAMQNIAVRLSQGIIGG